MLDASLIFDGTLNPTAGAAVTTTRASTNTIDLLVARDLGAGDILDLHCQVLTQFVGGTSLQVSFQTCATAGGSYVPLLFSPVFPTAQLIVGAPIFRFGLPLNQLLNATAGILGAPGRYLQLEYTVVGTYTAGSVFSYITPAKDRNALWIYPSNYTVYAPSGEI